MWPAPPSSRKLWMGFLMACVSHGFPPAALPASHQESALARLFDEEVLTDNVLAVRKKSQSLAPEDRYQYLRSWVFPQPGLLRLFAKLTSIAPGDTQTSDLPLDVTPSKSDSPGQPGKGDGGKLVSPVYDLISAAQQLNRLDELRAEVFARNLTGEVPERSRLCLLILIDWARGHEEEATRNADQLIARLATGAAPRLIDRMPETLFSWAAAERRQSLMDAERVLVPIWDNQIQPGRNHGPDSWDRMIPMLLGRVRHARQLGNDAHPPDSGELGLESWHAVTRRHSWTSGIGLPAGQWSVANRTASCLSRQDDEYLLFGTPLIGDFTFECLCSGFGYKDCHPYVSGTWIAPVYTHEAVAIGDLWAEQQLLPLTPKLSQVDDFIHYRVQVRGHVCSRYINGRLIQSVTIPADPDPWVAIRVPVYGNGQIRDVRISGSPTVPEQVTLSNLRAASWNEPLPPGHSVRPFNQLQGWMPWHIPSWKVDHQNWHIEQAPDGQAVIVGRREPELAGTGAEQLLRYHWPLLWDSDVTYEFFYREGESIAHPAIGRRAFVLSSSGLRRHWITNGYWDQSDSDPLNATPIGDSSATLPLQHDAWNTATLRISGDTLELRLNGVSIHQEQLKTTSDRVFGLFYDSGLSEARVRHVVLRGSWPKSLPSVNDQELRGTQADDFNRQRDALPAKVDIDFTRITQPELQQKFQLIQSPTSTIQLQPDGMHFTATSSTNRYAAASVNARLQVEGDFDITSRYENLQLTMPEEGFAGVYQCVLLTKPSLRNFNIIRSAGQYSNHPYRQVIQTEIVNWGPARGGTTYPAIFADESSAGRMRTIRRGKTLTTLAAADDSDSFQVLYSEEVSDDPLRLNEVLRAISYAKAGPLAEVRVVWKELQVRAEKITPIEE